MSVEKCSKDCIDRKVGCQVSCQILANSLIDERKKKAYIKQIRANDKALTRRIQYPIPRDKAVNQTTHRGKNLN